jgi:hypothetical protein
MSLRQARKTSNVGPVLIRGGYDQARALERERDNRSRIMTHARRGAARKISVNGALCLVRGVRAALVLSQRVNLDLVAFHNLR